MSNVIINQYSYEYVESPFINNSLKIERLGDTVIPKYLLFKTHNEMSSDDFLNSLTDSKFTLKIGGNVIIMNRIQLYANLIPIKQISPTTFCIEIPFNKFNDEIYLILLQYHDVICTLELSNETSISESSLTLEYKYVDSIKRNEIVSNSNEGHKVLQLFSSEYINLEEPTGQIISKLNFNCTSKGLIIEADINNITNLKLSINGIDLLNYNNLMLRLHSQILSPNLFYISYNPNIDFFNSNLNTYNAILNYDRLDSTILELTFEQPTQSIGIHSLNTNIFSYSNLNFGFEYYSNHNNWINIKTTNYTNYTNNVKIQENLNNVVWKYVSKPLNNLRNTKCPILLEEINLGELYTNCDVCKYNFSGEIFKIKYSNFNVKCPMCKSNWTNWIIYKNIEPDT